VHVPPALSICIRRLKSLSSQVIGEIGITV
jgi:hypothetical protein